jgi:hypothetical protein
MQQEQRPPEDQTTITLEVLRTDGHAALDTNDLPTIASARLRLLEVSSGDEWNTKTLKSADDLFAAPGAQPAIPCTGILTQASLVIFHTNSDPPTVVHLAPPDTVDMDADGHKATVHVFLKKPARKGFTIHSGLSSYRTCVSAVESDALLRKEFEGALRIVV